jgi:hypothetical protein
MRKLNAWDIRDSTCAVTAATWTNTGGLIVINHQVLPYKIMVADFQFDNKSAYDATYKVQYAVPVGGTLTLQVMGASVIEPPSAYYFKMRLAVTNTQTHDITLFGCQQTGVALGIAPAGDAWTTQGLYTYSFASAIDSVEDKPNSSNQKRGWYL